MSVNPHDGKPAEPGAASTRILILDDDPGTRQTLSLVLDRTGYEVHCAKSGQDGLERARQTPFDVALVDIRLPDGEGIDLIRPLKETREDLEILMVTGHGTMETALQALHRGARAYVLKPLDMDALLERIREAVERQALRRENRRLLEAYQEEIAERRQAEEALKASEEKYRMLVENAHEAIVVTQGSDVAFANTRAREITGYSQEELTSRPFDAMVHPEDREEVLDRYSRRLRGEDVPSRLSLRILDKEGRVRWLETNAVRIDWEGRPGTLTFFDDVTERKHLEGQLLQSEKMASVGQLAAGVAHEINNPAGFISSNLNTLSEYVPEIVGYLEECPREPDSDIDFILNDISELVSESMDGIERIRRIVADLKNFAHPGDEKRTHADLNENLASTLNIVWNELKYKAEVHTDYGDLPLVPCIPQQLNQVFMNLLVNAAQAIEEQGEIRLSTAWVDGHVEVRVADTGVGIHPEHLSRIFDPFFTTKDVGKGTGLGLNMSYNIVRKHGGDLAVESAPGEGTTFCVRIPVPEDAENASD